MYAENSYPSRTDRIQNRQNGSGRMRMSDMRSEQRIVRNRIRRQREIQRHFLAFAVTLCLIVTCSFTLSAFRSNAKTEPDTACKYYKSILISHNDTLWSLAEKYMDAGHYDSITDYINEVMAMNSLWDDSIQSGNYLIVPCYGDSPDNFAENL